MFPRLLLFLVLFVPCVVVQGLAQAAPSDAQAITSAIRERNFDRAVELSRSALQRSPNDARLWAFQGIALSASGHKKEALGAYNSALRISPNYLPGLEGAAELEYNAGSERAAALLQQILKVQPDNPTAHAMLGVLDYKRRDCPSAVKHFQAAKDVVASQPAALTEYGTCLVNLERTEEALLFSSACLKSSPTIRMRATTLRLSN